MTFVLPSLEKENLRGLHSVNRSGELDSRFARHLLIPAKRATPL